MNALIPIQEARIGGQVVQSVSGRDLHAFLEIGKVFGTWINDRIKQYKFKRGEDFEVFTDSGKNLSGGRPAKEYELTIDMAKELSMVERNEKGRQARQYFIDCERRAGEPSLPAIKDPRIAALVEVLVRQDALEQEQARQATEVARLQEEVAVIGARTQPENKHFTVMGYANLVGATVDLKVASILGRRCASLSRDMGLAIGDVRDPRFGSVHTYHESVLQLVLQEAA